MSLTTTPGYVRCAMPFGVNDHCDLADFLSRKTVIKKEISRKDHVLQEFHHLIYLLS